MDTFQELINDIDHANGFDYQLEAILIDEHGEEKAFKLLGASISHALQITRLILEEKE